MQPYQDQYIDVKGNRIRYWQAGEQGEYLLLIHGLGAVLEYWQYVIPMLCQHYRVIAIDLPGSGKSAKPDARFDLQYYSTFLSDFLAAKGVEKLYVAGHSLGGGLALKFTTERPDAVKKLFLINNAGFATQVTYVFRLMSISFIGKMMMNLTRDMYRKALEFSVYRPQSITDDFLDVLYPIVSNPLHRRTMLQLLKDNVNLLGMKASTWRRVWKAAKQLDQIPMFALWGADDRLLNTRKHLPVGKKRFPHMRTEVFEACGHMPLIEYPEKTVERMREFFG